MQQNGLIYNSNATLPDILNGINIFSLVSGCMMAYIKYQKIIDL